MNTTALASRVNQDRIYLALEPLANTEGPESSANVGTNIGETVGGIVGEMGGLVSLFRNVPRGRFAARTDSRAFFHPRNPSMATSRTFVAFNDDFYGWHPRVLSEVYLLK